MTSPETETTSDASLLREELERAEARVVDLREANAALERKLLRPTGLRTAGLATVAGALIAATLAYWAAARLGDTRAARENELAEKRHAVQMADERIIVDACRYSTDKAKLETARCTNDRDELRQRARDRQPAAPHQAASPCMCQAGDPLCSCL